MAEQITDKSIIEEGRAWLRITTDKLDDEIKQTIEACSRDLSTSGVDSGKARDYSDPYIKQAVKLYLKAFFGYDENAERFAERYEFLKKTISMAKEYKEATA